MTSFFKKLMASSLALSLGLTSMSFANDGYYPPSTYDEQGDWWNNMYENACLDVSFLYWKLGGDAFDYASEKSSVTAGGVTSYTQRVHEIKFDYDPGVRVGLGFDLPWSGWGAKINWTHFNTRARDTVTVNGLPGSVEALAPTFIAANATTTTTVLAAGQNATIHGHGKFRYDVVDLEMGKWLCCGDGGLSFRPHAGFRFANIHERLREDYTVRANTAIIDNKEIEHHNRFSGAGLRAGIDTNFYICEGWSLMGCFGQSVVWGHSRLRNRFTEVGGAAIEGSSIREKVYHAKYITNLGLSLNWKGVVWDCYAINVGLGWDIEYIANQHKHLADNNFNNFQATQSYYKQGSVCMQGLKACIGLDF